LTTASAHRWPSWNADDPADRYRRSGGEGRDSVCGTCGNACAGGETHRLIDAYLSARRGTNMTDSAKRAANITDFVHRGTLSDVRQSLT
jgi:hypothetical protein